MTETTGEMLASIELHFGCKQIVREKIDALRRDSSGAIVKGSAMCIAELYSTIKKGNHHGCNQEGGCC